MGAERESRPERALSPAEARISDAALNRCAEALRVVEDVCRFHWNLPGWCRELKELRHALLGIFLPDPSARLDLARFRDIDGDVGAAIPSPAATEARARGGDAPAAAGRREPLLAVAVRNLERAREALRTLEEVSRASSPRAAAAVESLRYRLYAVEHGVLALQRSAGASRFASCRLYLLVTSSLARGPLEEILAGAIEGGVDAVQLREKQLPDREALALGRRLRELTAAAGLPLVINDRVDLARALHADGVHLGQDDLPVGEARRLAGDEMAIGVSTHSVDQARAACGEGADYIGIGPVFPTSTKVVGPCLGIEGFRAILQKADMPAFAIGGVTPATIEDLAAAGARRVAVSSAILATATAVEARDAARAIAGALRRRDGGRER